MFLNLKKNLALKRAHICGRNVCHFEILYIWKKVTVHANVLGINNAHRTQRCLDSSQSCPAPERQRVADLSRPGFKKTLAFLN